MNANGVWPSVIAERGSQVRNDAFKLQTRHPENDLRTQVSSGRSDVVDAQCTMRTVESPHGCDQEIDKYSPAIMPLSVIRGSTLLLDGNAAIRSSAANALSIDLSRTPQPSVFATANAQPMLRFDIASDSGLFAFIRVAFAFIRVDSSLPTPRGWNGLGQASWQHK
jgi:hypothetical protein